MKNLLPFPVFFFLFFLSISVFAQAPDWKWQNPLPQGNYLNDVQFVDSQIGYAVGALGTIIKTTDGGITWNFQKSGTTNPLEDVHFLNSLIGWAVGGLWNGSSTILKTTNGGLNWQNQNSGTSGSLSSIHFVNSQTGWIVGWGNAGGIIIKTINGGQTWSLQGNGLNGDFYSVYFTDVQNGWVAGYNGALYKTTNGGQSWNSQFAGSASLYSVFFLNPQTGWIAGDGGVLAKTTDGGENWENQFSGTSAPLGSVYFIDAQMGWAVGGSWNGPLATILKTTNGGQNWVSLNIDAKNTLSSVHFKDSLSGLAVGPFGQIIKTTDGGTSWALQSKGPTNTLHSNFFINYTTGWVVGKDGIILKTKNGGKSWFNQNSGTGKELTSVYFCNPLQGWAVGFEGTILKTNDGGNTWVSQSSGTLSHLSSVHFIDDIVGYVVGRNGIILKTNNGGNSWVLQTSGTINDLHQVHFINSQLGWAVGGGFSNTGRILKTTNGGINWVNQTSSGSERISSLSFLNGNIGWIVGEFGNIRKTTNGGNTWFLQESGTIETFSSVQFINPKMGWIAGSFGSILKTTNGGNTWLKLNTGNSNPLFSIFFTDTLHGWAVGDYGTILTTTTNIYLETEPLTSIFKGKLFEKTASNCNLSNITVSGKLVKATPGPYYGYSNSSGNYSLKIPFADSSQTFTLQPINPNNPAFQSTTVCPPSGQISVTVDTIPDTLTGNNFGFEITPCHHLDVQLSSNRRRRCFRNSTAVSFLNQGSLPASNAYVLVEFPHWVRPLSASRSHVAINDSVWRFNLGNVAPGSGGSFNIIDSVLCGNVEVLGLSQCTKATIFPAPDCPPNSNWSGAEVSVSGKCENGVVKLGIYNRTNVNMPDSVDYFVFLDSVQVKVGKVKLLAGDSLKMNVVPNGMGVYLSVNQVVNHPGQVFVTTSVEGCGFFPLLASNAVSTHLPIAQIPTSKTQCLPIIGAYDPNDKQIFPIGFTNQNIIAPNTRLEYLVRFQNTGNDTAFTVYVIDTLDQNLNVESFEMGAASHPFELSMQTTKSGKTFLRWQFDNILLPDSNTNEPASNGFIQFRISPKPGLALGSKVRNHAEIYFDFNPPIITNQTLTTYDVIVFRDSTLNGNVQIVTSAEKQLEQQLGVKLYPNPVTQNQLTASFTEKGSLTLFDARGRIVFQKANIQGTETLPVSLKSGFYFATIETAKGRKSLKVVVE